MLPPVLEKLLILQGRDRRRLDLEAQLRGVPADVAIVDRKIAAERAAIEGAKAEWQQLESRKKLLEIEIGSIQQKSSRYKTQQLEVRKNDEYRALGHEIELADAAISRLEEEELGVMYAIEGAKQRFASAEAELKANISTHESRLRALRDREAVLSAELQAARAEVFTTASRRVTSRSARRSGAASAAAAISRSPPRSNPPLAAVLTPPSRCRPATNAAGSCGGSQRPDSCGPACFRPVSLRFWSSAPALGWWRTWFWGQIVAPGSLNPATGASRWRRSSLERKVRTP
jgi:predicted  nucleic acid-binding Zn-ribbon protein